MNDRKETMWPSMSAGGVPTFQRFRNWPTCHCDSGSAGHSNRSEAGGQNDEVNREDPVLCQRAQTAAERTCALTHPPPLTSSRCLFNPAPHSAQQVPPRCLTSDVKLLYVEVGTSFATNIISICQKPFPLVWAAPFVLLFPPADFIQDTPPQLHVTT